MPHPDESFLRDECGICVHGTVIVGGKGQVVIPKPARDELGIVPGDTLLCVAKGDLALAFHKPEAAKRFPDHEHPDVVLEHMVDVGSRGQAVIPKKIRDALSIFPGDALFAVTKLKAAVGMVKAQNVPRMMEFLRKEVKSCSCRPKPHKK